MAHEQPAAGSKGQARGQRPPRLQHRASRYVCRWLSTPHRHQQFRREPRARPQVLGTRKCPAQPVPDRTATGDIDAAVWTGLEVAEQLVVGLHQELLAQKRVRQLTYVAALHDQRAPLP